MKALKTCFLAALAVLPAQAGVFARYSVDTNRTEFLGASNPLSGASVFSSAVSLTVPGTVSISYFSSAARTYSVEHYLEASGTWETVLPALKGTDSMEVRQLATTEPKGIFRVRSELP